MLPRVGLSQSVNGTNVAISWYVKNVKIWTQIVQVCGAQIFFLYAEVRCWFKGPLYHDNTLTHFTHYRLVHPPHLFWVSWVLLLGAGLRAGVDLTRVQGWCPAVTGDTAGLSGGKVSAALQPSKNTSLAPTMLVPAGPGDITKEGRKGLTTPGKLEEEALPPAEGSVTWATLPWLPAASEPTESPLSLCRRSSAALCSSFPSLSWRWGRPSREIFVRNESAACLLLESFTLFRCSWCVFDVLLLLLVECRPHKAVAILVWAEVMCVERQ